MGVVVSAGVGLGVAVGVGDGVGEGGGGAVAVRVGRVVGVKTGIAAWPGVAGTSVEATRSVRATVAFSSADRRSPQADKLRRMNTGNIHLSRSGFDMAPTDGSLRARAFAGAN